MVCFRSMRIICSSNGINLSQQRCPNGVQRYYLSAIHGSAGHCRFPILRLPVASATRCRLRRSLTEDALRSLVHAFIYCRLDYCNALLAEIADSQVKRLQSVQNAAARLVSGARRRDHITPVLRSLHWLPVRRRIFFKTAVLVWKCIHYVAPAYLREVCSPVESVPGRPRLRSASTGCVEPCQPASGTSVSTVPQSGTACRLLCATTVFHWTRSRGGWRLICLDSNTHHPAPMRRFVTLAPSINVMTYLFTYLQIDCNRNFLKGFCYHQLKHSNWYISIQRYAFVNGLSFHRLPDDDTDTTSIGSSTINCSVFLIFS